LRCYQIRETLGEISRAFSIVNIVVMYEAQLTQKSLSNSGKNIVVFASISGITSFIVQSYCPITRMSICYQDT